MVVLLPERQTVTVSHDSDVPLVRRAARDMAAKLGFGNIHCEEVALAVSELASNLVRHARGGTIELISLIEGQRLGVRIQSLDSGPGIPDVEQAMTDGFSTSGGLGYGLGSVNRFMDSVEIASQPGSTCIVCTRWLRSEGPNLPPCPLSFGAATRAHPAMVDNGDTFVIERYGEQALVGVIDGVGHGALAHQAAQSARHYVESHADLPMADLFLGTGRVCRATRGVVMALARFDWSKARLTFASIGNIETRVFDSPEATNFCVRRGILGVNAPSPVVTEHRWEQGGVMVLHSDGLRSNWQRADFPEFTSASASIVANHLLSALARDNDDATVVVVKGLVEKCGPHHP